MSENKDAYLDGKITEQSTYRYGHIIHVLCATKSRFAELNSFSTETDFVEAPVCGNLGRYIRIETAV